MTYDSRLDTMEHIAKVKMHLNEVRFALAPSPNGYIARIEWDKEMMKTHRCRKCPGCDRYVIWEAKKK